MDSRRLSVTFRAVKALILIANCQILSVKMPKFKLKIFVNRVVKVLKLSKFWHCVTRDYEDYQVWLFYLSYFISMFVSRCSNFPACQILKKRFDLWTKSNLYFDKTNRRDLRSEKSFHKAVIVKLINFVRKYLTEMRRRCSEGVVSATNVVMRGIGRVVVWLVGNGCWRRGRSAVWSVAWNWKRIISVVKNGVVNLRNYLIIYVGKYLVENQWEGLMRNGIEFFQHSSWFERKENLATSLRELCKKRFAWQ